MQILIGFALCLVFFLCLSLAGYIGYRLGKGKPKTKLEEITEQEKILMKQREQGFKNVMNYNY
jgi:predicted DNA-binding transcriptional regulator